MKTLFALTLMMVVATSSLIAQAPLRSLTPSNLFVYSYGSSKPFPPGIPKKAYEKVLRDTIVGGKKYGVVFSSYGNTTRLERSDSLNIYELRNGTEIITQSLAWKVGDTIRFKFLWHGCDTCKYIISATQILTFPQDAKYYKVALKSPLNLLYPPYTLFYRPKYGIHQIDTGAATHIGADPMIGATGIDGAYIDGVLDRDTNTVITSIQQPASPATQQQPAQQPFSATRAVSVPVSFSAQHPFSEQTQISYTLPSSGAVEIAVYSMQGIRLTTLRKERQQAGAHNVLWNGKSSEGVDAPSGTYFFVLYFNDQQAGELQVLKTK